MPIFLLLGVFAVAHFDADPTRFGRHIYAVGGNPHAAKVSGLPVIRIRFLVYVISGGLAGLAGMILAARTGLGACRRPASPTSSTPSRRSSSAAPACPAASAGSPAR